MGKQKSHGGISKKIRVRNSGSTKIGHVGANHNSGKKGADYNRNARKTTVLSSGDAKRYRGLIG
jgi:ribosomal protein L35